MVLCMSTCSTRAVRAGPPDPGWSNRPRWKIPDAPRPSCAHGWSEGTTIRRLDRVSCAREADRSASASPRRRVVPAPWAWLSVPTPRPRRPLPPPPAARPRAPAPPQDLGGRWPDATRIAAWTPRACHAWLQRYDVPFRPLSRAEAPEVEQPIRLTGPLAGIRFVIPWSRDPSADHHAIWDCRLAAAMIPLAQWLSRHGVTEVQYFSVLRRGAIVRRRPRSQHNVGLAIDVLGFVRNTEGVEVVEEHYPRGEIRACPPPNFRSEPANLYARLVCVAHRAGLLHTILTPDHDHAHRNHLHLDLETGQASPADPFTSFAPGRRRSRSRS